MSYELRRVPKDWKHPKKNNRYIALNGGSFSKDAADWDEGLRRWNEGFYRVLSDEAWMKKDADMTYSYEKWAGERPEKEEYMPDWPDTERTHFQMYETVSEGTPVSPVRKTKEALARWLSKKHRLSTGHYATAAQWLAVIEKGWVPSLIAIPGRGLISAVEV